MRSKLFNFTLLLSTVFFFRLSAQDTLLLFHPTAYNVEVIQTLMNEGVFPLEAYHVLGVYHERETYDYKKAETYLDLHHVKNFSLLKIDGSLGPEDVFKKNECTPVFQKLFAQSRGALFMGGPDIPPVVYDEPVHLLTSVTDPFRHYFELTYIFHLLGGTQNRDWSPYMEQNSEYLVSGICLGMQTLHVATGGAMVQDIPSEIYGIWTADELLDGSPDQMHRNYADKLNAGCEAPTSYHFHHVSLEKGSVLTKGIGFKSKSEPLVLSSHHQALDKLGQDWEMAATSMDEKIIEAIQHKRYPNVLGVQFHPEKPGLFDPAIEHPQSCSSTINFQESIQHTDSYSFHLAYWKHLAYILQMK